MLLDNVVILDLETTGLNTERDEIIEIGAIKIKGSEAEEYQQLINPRRSHVSPIIFNLCQGITEQDLRKSPAIEEVEEELFSFIGELPIICHNADFDSTFLKREFGSRLNNIFLDSLQLFCLFKPQFPGHGIGYISKHYSGTEPEKQHRALDDAKATYHALKKLFEDLEGEENEILQKTVEYMQGYHLWHWLYLLQKVPYRLQNQKLKKIETAKKEKEIITSRYRTKDLKNILPDIELFEKEFHSYQYKTHQLKLAKEIEKAFSKEEALFAEAPTGSGKTLAYLIVALLWAVENNERIYISTNTKNLQQQIDKDLPRLCRVLGIKGLKHIEMKGINNYACKNKIVSAMEESPDDFEEKMARIFLYNWMERSQSGEIDTISYWFRRQNKKINPLLKIIGCYREDCLADNCAYQQTCFYNKKVSELHASSICTINHSLLLTWPFAYPPIEKLIIDEAHSLEDNCFSGFTEEVNSSDVRGLLYQFYRNQRDGYLHYLLFRYKQLAPAADFRPVFEYVNDLRDVMDKISFELGIISRTNDSGYSFREEISTEWEELKTLVLGCAATMEKIALFLENVLDDAAMKNESFGESTICRQGGGYIKAFRGWAATLKSVMNARDEENCLSVEYNESKWSFRVTPVDISPHFSQKVLAKLDSVVLTSATLSEKNSYDRLAENLGFNTLENKNIRYMEPLKHVFDYEKNSVLAIPEDSRDYNEDEFLEYAAEAIFKISSVIGGRTLVLFSNLQRLNNVFDKVNIQLEKVGVTAYNATEGSRQNMVEMFREDRNAVLFGSKALFEGVDIKGPGLSCVVIDKLPYPYPADPLYSARSRYLKSKERSPFSELSLSVAVRTFRQQFGRLIRSGEDKGFVLVLSQLNRDRNRKHIISELPPARIIKEPLDVIVEEMKKQFLEWGYKTY